MTYLIDGIILGAIGLGYIATGVIGAIILARIALGIRDLMNRNDR